MSDLNFAEPTVIPLSAACRARASSTSRFRWIGTYLSKSQAGILAVRFLALFFFLLLVPIFNLKLQF